MRYCTLDQILKHKEKINEKMGEIWSLVTLDVAMLMC